MLPSPLGPIKPQFINKSETNIFDQSPYRPIKLAIMQSSQINNLITYACVNGLAGNVLTESANLQRSLPIRTESKTH